MSALDQLLLADLGKLAGLPGPAAAIVLAGLGSAEVQGRVVAPSLGDPDVPERREQEQKA